ncbi:MAG: hypothetical protein JRG84_10950 [Deltaproteobacteria bacterium]|nr:hypothetical protein [Deltaproteobacteria bacterium]
MGKYGETEIHPVGLALTLLMGVVMLTARRDRAVLAFLLVACLVTHAQRVVVASIDFSMLRIVIIFGWIRVLAKGETSNYRFQPLDATIPVWLFFGALAYLIGPRSSYPGGFVQRLGSAFDAGATYFLFRILLRDVRDLHRTIVAFGWISILMIGPMILENLTGRNVFSALGGVNERTTMRDGRLRCQASFSHPIMAGNFGATSAALLGALWMAFPKERLRHGVALAAAAGITVLSASGGPVLALASAILAWGLWPLREWLSPIRWATVAALTVIHFVREQPVWHLIGRLSSITGGTGYHRVSLITNFFEHFKEWAVLGTYTTRHWKGGHGAQDITNQYILEGVRGGLPTLLSFVSILVVGFQTVGRSVRRAFARDDWSPADRRTAAILGWGLGVCLFTHSTAFIGVSYFGQLLPILYLHLAMIASFASALQRGKPSRELPTREEAEEPEKPGTPALGGLGAALRNPGRRV